MGAFRPTAPGISSSEIMNVKLQDGDGTLLADVGLDVTKNALYVMSESLATNAGITAAQGAVTTALSDGSQKTKIVDVDDHNLNIQDTGEADINIEKVNNVDINVGSGTVSTGTLRVTLGSDDPVAATTGTVGNAVTRVIQVGVKGQTGFPSAAVDNGDVVDPLHDEYGRQWIKGYDPGSNSLLITDVAPIQSAIVEITFTQLTAAGSTTAVNIQEKNCFTFQIVVAAINTSVTVRVEGSLDNSSWFNLDDAGVDTTYNANGTYQLSKSGVKVKYVRFTFVSEVGGTAVTLDVKVIAGR